jgi:selenocysteine lyase/cysteine desulfurase
MNIQQLRDDTPGTQTCIHFNNAGASLMSKPVLDALYAHLELETYGGGYEAEAKMQPAIQAFYTRMAQLFACHDHNIAYCANATDAYSRALSSIPFKMGDVILTTTNDYISNQIAFFSLQKRVGVQVVRAENTLSGEVDLNSMEALMKQYRPKMVSVTHVPANSGLIQPVEAVGKLCQQYDTWYFVDGCQSAGQLELDLLAMGCDFFSGTFRKFMRGPRGGGFLYVSDKALVAGLEPMFIDSRGAIWNSENTYQPLQNAKRFEDFENSIAVLLGCSAAVQYMLDCGMSAIETRIRSLAAYTRTQLAMLPNITVLDKGQNLCGIVTCAIAGKEALPLRTYLHEHRINTSIGFRNFALLDFNEKNVDWALRLSPHAYNTVEEVDKVMEALR